MTAIAFAQLLNPKWRAKLIQFNQESNEVDVNGKTSSSHQQQEDNNDMTSREPKQHNIKWNVTSFRNDPDRVAYHERKMISKDSRPEAQIRLVGEAVPRGHVWHIRK